MIWFLLPAQKKFAGQAVGGITWPANGKATALSVGAYASSGKKLFLPFLIGTVIAGRFRLIGIALFFVVRIA
jgi:hypothetical protein